MNELKIYTMDCGCYGSIVVVAESEEEARVEMRKALNYEGDKVKIEEHPIRKGFMFHNYGDM